MIIAISGSQGSGKTTILNELEDRGYTVIKRKFSRSILNDWNVSLDEVYNNPILNQTFHTELIKRKYDDELEFTLTSELVFTERSFSDFFTYALITLGPYNKHSEWLDGYFIKCKEHAQCYSRTFYVKSKFSNNIEKDGVRSINTHYSLMVDKIMLDNIQNMVYSGGVSIIEEESLSKRIDIILNNI